MKSEASSSDQAPKQSASRRKVLAIAVGAPLAALTGCVTGSKGDGSQSSIDPSTSRGPRLKLIKSSKRGKGVLSGKHGILPWPSGSEGNQTLVERMQWDFEAFIYLLLKQFEEGRKDTEVDQYAATPRRQLVFDPSGQNGPNRNLNIHLLKDVEFVHGINKDGKDVVVGFIVQAKMLRATGSAPGCGSFDDPMKTEDCEHEHDHRLRFRTNHLISSSSSSSSSWGI